MPVAINMPQRQPPADPLEKLASVLQLAKAGFGIAADMKTLDAERDRKKTLDKKTELEIKKMEGEQANAAQADNPDSPMSIFARDVYQKKTGIAPPPTANYSQLGKTVESLSAPKQTDPLLEQIRRDKAEEARQKRTPRGRLNSLNSGDKQRFDNVVLGINAVTGMEKGLANGDWTVHPIGDNDFTRNRTKWEEAIGRMQSGGAINDAEAERFRSMVPGVKDSHDQQVKKLADMRAVMEQRFGTFGFDKSNAEELGLNPEVMGWAQPPAGGPAITSNGDPIVTKDIQSAAAAELARRRAQAKK